MLGRARYLVVCLALVVASACQAANGRSDDAKGQLNIVTTVAPITSIVANVAGPHASISGIVPEGTNSHTFEPPPGVAELLAKADVVFLNGLSLEQPATKLARQNADDGARVVELGTTVLPKSEYVFDFSFPKSEGKPNPHLWTDPTWVKRYVEVVRDTLVAVDREHSADYLENASRYLARVGRLDEAIRTASATVPRDRRKLLTYHDAYAYFARTYGWVVIGAIQVKSFEDPTPKEVASLIDQVRAERVPAIFGSEVFPSPVLAQIGKEAGVAYVDVLRDDDLPGAPGDREHSLLGLLRFDFVTLVEALGGDAAALRTVDVSDAVGDSARYPQ